MSVDTSFLVSNEHITSVFEYLSVLPQNLVRELYNSPWACLAVLRSLTPLAKQYTIRCAFLTAISAVSLRKWTSELSIHNAAIQLLVSRHILSPMDSQK